MTRDIASVVRSIGGELIEGARNAGTPVDEVVSLDDFSVVGHPGFATLVVVPARRIPEVLDPLAAKAGALREAVLVTHGNGAGVRRAVEAGGATAILDAGPSDELLTPLLTAMLAVDQAAEDRAVTSAMKVLTLAARRGGVSGVVAELAHRIDGWVVLLDRHGQVITTAGAGGLHIQDAIAVALGRAVRVRHRGLQVHAVGPGEDLSAQLVVSSRTETSSRSRELGSQAAALLDLLLRTDDPTRTERLGRAVMIDALIAGGEAAATLLRKWGVHESSLTGYLLTARSAAVEVERLVSHWLDELGAAHILTSERGTVTGFVRDDQIDALSARVEAYASALFLGIGSPAPTEALARSVAEARQAVEAARAEGRRVVRYRSIPTVQYVIDRLGDGDALQVSHLLDPLRDSDGEHGVLTATLRGYLAENGAWGVTADRLGVHRQTLTARIHQVEELTGLSMADADDRTAAWLALRALDRPRD